MAQKKFLWAIVRRFSTIFKFFGWERELYHIFHEDHENQVLFLSQLNGYLATSTFRNRKYILGVIESIWFTFVHSTLQIRVAYVNVKHEIVVKKLCN